MYGRPSSSVVPSALPVSLSTQNGTTSTTRSRTFSMMHCAWVFRASASCFEFKTYGDLSPSYSLYPPHLGGLLPILRADRSEPCTSGDRSRRSQYANTEDPLHPTQPG